MLRLKKLLTRSLSPDTCSRACEYGRDSQREEHKTHTPRDISHRRVEIFGESNLGRVDEIVCPSHKSRTAAEEKRLEPFPGRGPIWIGMSVFMLDQAPQMMLAY
jgi:hypothetical protein